MKDHCIFILKYRKHLYILPLFFIGLSMVCIMLANFIYDRYLVPEPVDEITMDFAAASDYDFTGSTVVIDPGHGGHDPGAPSASGLTEDEIVFNIAAKFRERLEESGAEVKMTRGVDSYTPLEDRNLEGDLFISLHSDAMEDPSITGFTTYYTHGFQEGLASSVNSALDRHSYFYNRGNHSQNYQVTWQLDYPGVLVELGYLSNEFDDYMLSRESYQELMANALMEGIHQYLDG